MSSLIQDPTAFRKIAYDPPDLRVVSDLRIFGGASKKLLTHFLAERFFRMSVLFLRLPCPLVIFFLLFVFGFIATGVGNRILLFSSGIGISSFGNVDACTLGNGPLTGFFSRARIRKEIADFLTDESESFFFGIGAKGIKEIAPVSAPRRSILFLLASFDSFEAAPTNSPTLTSMWASSSMILLGVFCAFLMI